MKAEKTEAKAKVEKDNKKDKIIADLQAKLESTSSVMPQFIAATTEEARAKAQHEMLQARRIAVSSGTVKKIKGNKSESYEFPEWEKNLFHVLLTMRPPENTRGKTFVSENGKTFEKTELPTKIWKGPRQVFERMEKGRSFKMYQGVEILHDPRL